MTAAPQLLTDYETSDCANPVDDENCDDCEDDAGRTYAEKLDAQTPLAGTPLRPRRGAAGLDIPMQGRPL